MSLCSYIYDHKVTRNDITHRINDQCERVVHRDGLCKRYWRRRKVKKHYTTGDVRIKNGRHHRWDGRRWQHKCEKGECKTQPCYGIEAGRARYCVKHALDGMINVQAKRCER